MIKNELEYEYSQEWAEKFKRSISAVEKDEEGKRNDLSKWESNRSVLRYHLEELEKEIAEYERLINCDCSQPIEIEVKNFHELADALIKARMAAKISHEELAEIIGFDSGRIKQCEDKKYQCASFGEMLEISAALGIELRNTAIWVNFEEIETGKKIAEKWRKRREKLR
jgi:ribosome-binding protein aMBF1 (putative translation factor)